MSTAAHEPTASVLALSSYICGTCGYGIRAAAPALPACPMCRADDWRLPGEERHSVAR